MNDDSINSKPPSTASPEERIAYFKGKKLAHRNLAEAWKQLQAILSESDPSALVLIYGPTGVGKTTLANRVKEYLKNEEEKHPRSPGTISVASIEAVASSNSGFDWRDYYIRALQALDEPLIEHKLDPNFMLYTAKASLTFLRSKRPSLTDLRRGLESCLKQRMPKAFIIDEAQHLKKIASGKRLIDQMDTIKSLANMTGIKHLLFGTYELFGLTNLSAQLNRRTVEIHLPRYRFDNPEDMEEFILFLSGLEEHLPLNGQTVLSENPLAVNFIYKRSAGCPGILKDWMTRALAIAIEENSERLEIAHLEKTAIPDAQLARIAREIMEGEAQLSQDKSEEISSMLGMILPVRRETRRSDVEAPLKKGGNSRPGVRKPSRDKIGRSALEAIKESKDDTSSIIRSEGA